MASRCFVFDVARWDYGATVAPYSLPEKKRLARKEPLVPPSLTPAPLDRSPDAAARSRRPPPYRRPDPTAPILCPPPPPPAPAIPSLPAPYLLASPPGWARRGLLPSSSDRARHGLTPSSSGWERRDLPPSSSGWARRARPAALLLRQGTSTPRSSVACWVGAEGRVLLLLTVPPDPASAASMPPESGSPDPAVAGYRLPRPLAPRLR
ncbi:hypothetical protein BRADI_3g18008v3 [Brachypodium distachyon]|uniref:Uncharacterized protein n=1 Tax=Brachypodium distachyon TaxID=15368 RepID=A0A0Q3FBK9_BRADI|nr:hypothetical protein BRADI_3g18008v3 [Brachypodium distachyon]